jgi:hypothetical protein
MSELVHQLSVPPYNIKYWEIGNEPDAPIISGQAAVGQGYGCWGRKGETNYGGEAYGEMLKAVYPAIKAADPSAMVLMGGLLLDCDPINPPDDPAHPGQKKDCSMSRFLVGVLANGNGKYFDAVSYHAYDYYSLNGTYVNGGWHSDVTTGPSSIARDNYIKSVLASAGYHDKLLFNTESSLVCLSPCPKPNIYYADYENTKAAYVAVNYVSAITNNISVRIWYSAVTAWRSSGLVSNYLKPLPAYFAFKTAATELRNAKYVKDLASQLPTGVKGSEFTRGGRTIWFLWGTTPNSPIPVYFNRAPDSVFDTVGQSISPTQMMPVDTNPRYFEWDGKP